jgi:uncharacterized protein YbbK (DUF523 family)
LNILISSCLLGNRVRYDAEIKTYDISRLKNHNLIPACPEVDGGLPVPRPASELQKDGRVVNIEGLDVTEAFEKGAKKALQFVKEHDIKVAILKSKSPSCSNKMIYDGSFRGVLTKGKGITVKLLESHSIRVFDESEIDEAIKYLEKLDV